MPTMAEVVRQHGPAYVSQYGAQMLPSHSRALRDIASCRTSQLGGHLAMCAACGEQHLVYHSWRSRACPRCGHTRAEQWVQRHAEHLLPVTYFHVVFTLPAELRRLVREHQRALIPVLFRAAYDALAALCRDPRHLVTSAHSAYCTRGHALLSGIRTCISWCRAVRSLQPDSGSPLSVCAASLASAISSRCEH